MTAHILFGATNPSTGTLSLWATAAASASGAVDLGVAIAPNFDPVRIGAITVFIGGSAQASPELWRTDGTLSGTVPIGLTDASGQALTLNALQSYGGGAVVAAQNPKTHLDSVWFVDGNAGDNRLLASGLAASNFQVVGNALYFTAASDPFNPVHQVLYRSDGTEAGTVQVSPPGAVVAPDAYAALASGSIVFENDRNASGAPASSLWVSDGTAVGTRPLAPANLGSGSGGDNFVSLGGVAVFGLPVGSAGGSSLWVSNGSNAGTRQIMPGGVVLRSVSDLTLLGGAALFAGVTSTGQTGLWSTDGTDAGTRELAAFAQVGALVAFGTKVAFTAPDSRGRPSLWVTDGTAAGTTLIAPAGAASTGLAPQGLFAYFDQIGFTGTDASGQSGVWLSDGTGAGTHETAIPGAITVQTGANQPGSTAIAGSGNLVVLGGAVETYVATDGDTVRAGAGQDTVTAASGAVQVTGGAGTLRFTGGSGFNTVTGGLGAETLAGGSGGGIYSGGAAGGNVLVASGGNTTLIGGGGHDALFGAQAGSTDLVAQHGGETLVGGGGGTMFTGGAFGGAVMFTGGGPATVAAGASGGDIIVGGAGTLLVRAAHGEAVFAGSGTTTVQGSAAGADSLIGGTGSLVVNEAGANVIVVGGLGPSAIASGTGYGLIFQGVGAMQIASGGGPLQLVAGPGSATVGAGAGGITLDVVKGHGGGLDVIGGFRPLVDHLDLFGFTAADVHTHVQNASVTLSLSDGSRVTLLGVTDPGHGLVLI